MDKIKKPELLAPAGNMEKLRMALLYGADAVYLGGKDFGLRAFADNFAPDEMREAVTLAHKMGRKIYVTVNIFAHNADLEGLPDYLRQLEDLGVDAILVSDPGVFMIARQTVPDLPLHVSTQANTTNWAAARAWKELGAQRIVLARELSIEEIGKIAENSGAETEVFVHGAMCISYSGRCWLSSYLTGRDGNRGACAQVCRWGFALTEEKRPGQYFDVEEDRRGTYVMNSADLCLLDLLPNLIRAGVDSLKIEGRMKSVHYVATVTGVYRRAIDAFCKDPEHFRVLPEWKDELEKVSHRPYTTGFALHHPGEESQIYTSSSYVQSRDFVGLVERYDASSKRLFIEQRNNVKAGEELEYIGPDGSLGKIVLEDMEDEEGSPITVAPHARQHFSVACGTAVPPFSMLRRIRKDGAAGA